MTRLLIFCALLAAAPVSAIDFRQTDLGDGFVLLQGQGGNILLSEGDDGILIIDTDLSRNAEDLERALRGRGDLPVYVINTHWHFDHVGGNARIGPHSTIVAHHNVHLRMQDSDNNEEDGLPDITYAQDAVVHFNGHQFRLVHYPAAHTDGDTVVFIDSVDLVHMGDNHFKGNYPFIDLNSGGSLAGLLQTLTTIMDAIDDDTRVVPGHGGMATRDDLAETLSMLKESEKTVRRWKRRGLSLEAAQERGLPKLTPKWGNGFINEERWITTLYNSID